LETRKLQKVGYSTHCISLPRKWVKEWKLKQGDPVILIPERDGSLKLTPQKLADNGPGSGEYIIDSDLCNEPGMLMRLVIGNYILGRDSYRIISSRRISSSHMEEIRATARRLIGLSILEESSDLVIIQCSIDPGKFNIQSLIRRLSIIALTMLDEAMQTLATSNPSFAKDAISRENEVDMIYRLTLRLLASAQGDRSIAEKIGLAEPLRILANVLVSKYLELVADQVESIARRIVEVEGDRSEIENADIERMLDLSKLASSIIQDAVDCFFTEDIKKANNVLENKNVMDMEERKFHSDIRNFNAIAQGLAIIAEKGAGIAEVAFDRVLERPTDVCRIVTQE
jgi:phosphate uptake regulator